MGFSSAFLLLALVVSPAPQLPAPFPRPGTTALLENDAVAVWNVSWPAAPADGLRQVAGTPTWDTNPRAAAWLVMPGTPLPTHRHVGDAVELTFDGTPMPRAVFVPAGTVHAGPTLKDGERAYIFEFK